MQIIKKLHLSLKDYFEFQIVHRVKVFVMVCNLAHLNLLQQTLMPITMLTETAKIIVMSATWMKMWQTFIWLE